ncbi:MAG: glycoside hydrolase family 20 zincin-like fold domain-containing protein [Bacteroidota bacterium]
MSFKKILSLLHVLLLTLNVLAQTTFENGRLIYSADELENGEFIKEFMLIGPFSNSLSDGEKDYFHLDNSCLGFKRDYLKPIGGEQGVKPNLEQEVSLETGEVFKWELNKSTEDIIDLKKIFVPNEGVVAYAAIWIESDKEQEKILGVGSNDGMKAWLNGKLLLKVHKPRIVKIDDEYLKLKLKKGNNILLLKIEQGLGGWGFALRPVDNETAWKQVQNNLDVAMNSEFVIEGDKIIGTIGDNNIVGQLSNLPMAEIEFSAIDKSHSKIISAQLGSKLVLDKKEFTAKEYSIKISFDSDNGGHSTYAYMNTSVDVVEELRELLAQKNVVSNLIIDPSPLENYYLDYIKTVKWLDSVNKLWEHPYGYRRYLGGLQKAFKGLEELSESNNNFEKVFPQPKSMEFNGAKCKISPNWKVYYSTETKDVLNEKIESFWRGYFSQEVNYTSEPGKSKTINIYLKENSGLEKEAYEITVEKNIVKVVASAKQGLFYGLSTLVQALEISHILPTGIIIDSPAYSVRSVMLSNIKAEMSDDFKAYIKKLSGLRYNEIYIYSEGYLHLDNHDKLKEITEIFDYCKDHFIEPVPFIETFGSATFTGILDPCLDEGIYHERESFISDKFGFIKLGVKRIHDCDNSTIRVFAGELELVKNTDYMLLITEEPKIKIINSNYIQKELKLSFDEVDFTDFPHPATCPSNPKGWEIQERVISSIIKELKPNKLHISQDEVGFVNKCSLCKARGISNRELMIDQINRVHEIIRKYDDNIGIYIWGDMFSDLQNAPKIDAVGAIDGLPKDIMVNDWNYLAVYHSDKAQTINQMNFYLERGYKTGGVAWFEPANILDIMLAGKKYPDQFMGIMHSAWYGYKYSLLPVAEANWTGRIIIGELGF